MTLKRLFVMAALFAISGPAAWAQDRGPWPSEVFNPPAQSKIAGAFDYYALILSWNPTYCSAASQPDETQCNRSDGRRFSFVLQSLRPEFEKGFPEGCRLQRRTYVPQASIERMLDIMPSPSLVANEYRLHGTCSGMMPDPYFTLARKLYSSIRIPERYGNPFELQYLAPNDVIVDFMRANPQIKPDMMAVACGGAGNKLKDVRICFSKNGQLRGCGSNEDQGTLCQTERMMVPPVRSTARSDILNALPPAVTQSFKPAPVPRPKLIEGPHGE